MRFLQIAMFLVMIAPNTLRAQTLEEYKEIFEDCYMIYMLSAGTKSNKDERWALFAKAEKARDLLYGVMQEMGLSEDDIEANNKKINDSVDLAFFNEKMVENAVDLTKMCDVNLKFN